MISKYPIQFAGVFFILYIGSTYINWLGAGLLVIMIKLFVELLRRLPLREQKMVRPYLIAGLIIYLLVAVLSIWMPNNPKFESIETWLIIAFMIGLALVMLFTYYFQTRLNALPEFKSLNFIQLMITPWFLIAYREVLEEEPASEREH